MKSVNEIKEIIMEHRRELEEKFKVKNIAIFGSYARNEQRKTSDVDILVEFSEPVGLLFFHLADYLEEILGVKVDLLTVDGIKPNRRKYVMENIIYV
ncbi:MAG: nucleotidyltransferase family protein [Nitrososphaeria archaeon]